MAKEPQRGKAIEDVIEKAIMAARWVLVASTAASAWRSSSTPSPSS